MQNQTVTHSTFVIERTYPASAERVFAAFSDPARKSRWFGGSEARALEQLEMDFQVGGRERIRYRMGPDTPFPGAILTNNTCYQDIVPNRRIVLAYAMSFGDQPFSASLATFELVSNSQGTTLIFTEQGAYFENSDGPQGRQDGWTKLLDRLGEELAGRNA